MYILIPKLIIVNIDTISYYLSYIITYVTIRIIRDILLPYIFIFVSVHLQQRCRLIGMFLIARLHGHTFTE